MALDEVWSRAEALRRALGAHTDPAAARVAEPFGLNLSGWALLLRAHLAAPEPVSASRCAAWNPYVNPWTYEAGLRHLAALGLLAGQADGDYALTPAGQSALENILSAVQAALAGLAPLEAHGRVADLLEALCAASLAAPEPRRKALLRMNRRLADESPDRVMVRLDLALAGLVAFRDDCRLDAWQPLMVSGPAWDALGLLCRDQAATLDEVYGRLARRGWPRDAYARALQELVRRDWLAGAEPYALTPQGRRTHERAETQTSRLFFAPWRTLEAGTAAELRPLLEAASAALAPLPHPQ